MPVDSDAENSLASEASYFGDQNNTLLRSRSWSSIPLFQHLIQQASNLNEQTRQALKNIEAPRALSLACGDMQGEYKFLVSTAGVKHIDAFDISEGQREKFYSRPDLDDAVSVDYQIADVNAIELPENHYDIVYIQRAYHHLEAIEHVASQINHSLKANGIFVLVDYVGANFLQRTKKQRKICEMLWPFLAERYRRSPQGQVRVKLQIPDKEKLSPYEAIRAEEILPVLQATFDTQHLFLFAGILFPLLEGFAQNYTDSDEDKRLLKSMWDLDQKLIEAGDVEPNFVRAVFRKKV
ncbi:MAG: class I SAM-dependent methyltransferase [Pseudomonadales bacterium]|nr:class I SAM-dependent methyltransferase [Pseudomonadales bacterium]